MVVVPKGAIARGDPGVIAVTVPLTARCQIEMGPPWGAIVVPIPVTARPQTLICPRWGRFVNL